LIWFTIMTEPMAAGEAGRAPYLAGLHGALAFSVERMGKAVKRHRGAQRELRRLTKGEPRPSTSSWAPSQQQC
jgi:hypothetical protein